MKCLLVLLLLCGSIVCLGQQQAVSGFKHKMHGIVQDKNGSRIAGVRMIVNGDAVTWTTTDLNGEFVGELPVGEHVLTLTPESQYPFRAFLKIVAAGPNADNVVFTVDADNTCGTSSDGTVFAGPTTFPKPSYPAAARAVRAVGEVNVFVKIGPDGKVTSATVQTGHPLLRKASVVAAKQAIFEAANAAERESRLVYVFLTGQKIREGLTIFANPCRLNVIAPPEVIDIYDI